MIRPLLTLSLLAAPLMMAGCDSKLLTSAIGAAAGATGSLAEKVKVSGSIYAPAAQVAVVAAGGLNWRVAARSDEKGVPQAKVTFAALSAPALTLATAQTDATGKFTIEVPENTDYVVNATFEAKDGTSVTLTGLAKVTSSAPSFQLDAAHHLVAAKLVDAGLKKIDASKLSSLVSAMAEDLSAVSVVPTPTSRSAAADAFDANASSDTKAAASAATK
jgi:hypothetical protein